MTWRLSVFSDEAGKDLSTQIKAMKQSGLTWMDLRRIDDHYVVQLPMDRIEAIAAELQEADLKVNMFATPIGKMDFNADLQEDLDLLDKIAAMKDLFRCNALRIFSYAKADPEMQDHDFMRESLSRLHRLVDQAKSLGLVLYHENAPGYYGETLERVLTLIRDRRLGENPHFQFLFDLANFQRVGESPWHNWCSLQDHISAIHLKECDDSKAYTPLGRGDGEVFRILSRAAETKWEGTMTLEPHLHLNPSAIKARLAGEYEDEAETDLELFTMATQTAQYMMNRIGLVTGLTGMK